MDKNELKEALKAWFRAENGEKYQWSRDEVGVFLKNELEKQGHWKALPRGNPKKGKRIGDLKKAIKNGYDPSQYEENY